MCVYFVSEEKSWRREVGWGMGGWDREADTNSKVLCLLKHIKV